MLNRLRALFAAASLITLIASPKAQAQSKLMDKETFFQMESISSPVIAPDGSQIVFTRGFVDTIRTRTRRRCGSSMPAANAFAS